LRNLKDAKIALLEARMSDEMASLIERSGAARPFCVPAVRESLIENPETTQQVSTFIDHLVNADIRIVAFQTGVGVHALCKEAERLQRLPELLTALQQVTIVARGQKPSGALKRYGVQATISAREPYTTQDLLDAFDTIDVRGATIGVVHYGERNAAFVQSLQERGAHVEELCLYEWLMPEDTSLLQTLIHDIIDAQVDAVVFTSQIQVRHLFQIAADLNLAQELALALNTKTIVASIGPTCTGVLQNYGVTPHVVPEHPKMGHLVKALISYMSLPTAR